MKTQFNSLLNRVDTRLAACAAAAGASLAVIPSSDATIVYSGVVNIAIPLTTTGVYLNVVTGVNGPSPAGVPGWDINPWNASNLSWFNPGAPAGGVYVTGLGSSAALPDNLGLGVLIDGAQGYGSGISETTGATAFNLNSDNNWVGFRFTEAGINGGAVCYGWVQVHIGASMTDPARAIIGYAYDDSGAGIVSGVPEPSTFALLGMMAAGALGVREWRKRKAA